MQRINEAMYKAIDHVEADVVGGDALTGSERPRYDVSVRVVLCLFRAQSPGGDGFGEGVYHTVLASWLVTAKDQVHSGGDGADGRLAYLAAAELGDRIHFEAVAYHHALEAELVPEEARDRRLAHRRGYAGVERFKDHCARAKARRESN